MISIGQKQAITDPILMGYRGVVMLADHKLELISEDGDL